MYCASEKKWDGLKTILFNYLQTTLYQRGLLTFREVHLHLDVPADAQASDLKLH